MGAWGGFDAARIVFLTCMDCAIPTPPPGAPVVTHGLCPCCAVDRDAPLPDLFCRRCGRGHAAGTVRCECGCELAVGTVVGLR